MAAIDKSIYEKFIVESADGTKSADISEGVIAFTYFENIFSPYLREGIIKYKKEYPVLDIDTMGSWKCDDVYTFKKYENDDDGFKIWHTEQGPTTPSRILAWQFYLNNAESGTEFMHYPTIRAIMGRLIIWPAAWTHFHRSEPNKGLKYIISGWHYYSNEK